MPKEPAYPRPAYDLPSFLESEDARPLRVLAEYLEPLDHFRPEGVYDTIVFFGSARLKPEDPLGHYYDEARAPRSRSHIAEIP